ncbi:hypothetical protein GH865_12990 [Rhodocyclus tenuis]|uniref:DUF4148 domain-containing protein n=1 Tax=Rhodocyclus tenuis TaxID=1066 RepID=A0A6L5JVB3_RHOTE|nr:hypothetical protein [Rhodocyclus gracilis]MRD74154.1 hypothetical protein [Rhodocyclus gracilis]
MSVANRRLNNQKKGVSVKAIVFLTFAAVSGGAFAADPAELAKRIVCDPNLSVQQAAIDEAMKGGGEFVRAVYYHQGELRRRGCSAAAGDEVRRQRIDEIDAAIRQQQ